MKSKIQVVTALSLAFLFSANSIQNDRRGSVVVWAESPLQDYFVVAADSRIYNETTKQAEEGACKIIGLGPRMLFYTVGHTMPDFTNGSKWRSTEAAARVYRSAPNSSPEKLSSAWAEQAKRAFTDINPASLQKVVGDFSLVVHGGFITIGAKGAEHVYGANLEYTAAKGLYVNPIVNGPIGGVGSGASLAREFDTLSSERAQAFRNETRTELGRGVDGDVNFVRAEVQFAIDNAGFHSQELGPPVDIAVVSRNGPIVWKQRKPSCHSLDVK